MRVYKVRGTFGTQIIHEVFNDSRYTIQPEGHRNSYTYYGLQSWLENHAEELR